LGTLAGAKGGIEATKTGQNLPQTGAKARLRGASGSTEKKREGKKMEGKKMCRRRMAGARANEVEPQMDTDKHR